MTITKTSSEYFEQVAGQWDNLRSGYFTEEVRAAAIAKAYLRPESIVADVGAGTGFMAAGLAPLVHQVHVVDGSAAMIAVARKNLAGATNVMYHVADGQALTLPDGSMDVVFANMYLHHCPGPLASIREMVRVLKPGGRLVITDLDTHPYEWLKTEMADTWMGFEWDQIRGWFHEADLVNVLVACTSQSCCAETQDPTVDEQGRTAKISVFVATGTRRLKMREAVQAAYGARAVQEGCGCEKSKEVDPDTVTQSSSSCCSEPAPKSSCCGDSASKSSCCSGSQDRPDQDFTFVTGYSPQEKAAVPGEAEEISLGCGNPIAMAALRPGEVVMDIGSGGGMDSFLAAGRVGPTGKVIGVDMTPAMLERARTTATKSGIQNVEFRQGQAEALPVEDQTIDVILSNCVINLCEDKGLVFREAYRTLKPGGRLEVSDMVSEGPIPLEARGNRADWSECISGALPEKEYLDLISQAGFTKVLSRRSSSRGILGDVAVYSVTVSAYKPGTSGQSDAGCSCGGCEG